MYLSPSNLSHSYSMRVKDDMYHTLDRVNGDMYHILRLVQRVKDDTCHISYRLSGVT